MILSTRGRYAVMALVDMAANSGERPLPLSEIAERQEIPLAYLEQIFAKLRKAELITSVRGPGGGYFLQRAAADIRISDIISASEEAIKITRCEGADSCTTQTIRCLTHDLWDGLGRYIYHYLNNLTLADVCEGKILDKFPQTKNAAENEVVELELSSA